VTVAVILAGGVGNRLNAPVPKQFIKVGEKPVIVYTLEKFNVNPDIDAIVVPCLEPYVEEVKSYREKYGIEKLLRVIPGGETFLDSCRVAADAIADICGKGDIYIMHMAVAPMVDDEVISDCVQVAKEKGNAFSADPSYKCMCEMTSPGESSKYLDREIIFALNTPQAFEYSKLMELFNSAGSIKEGLDYDPHLSTLYQLQGETIYFSKGKATNIKITTKEDLELFASYTKMEQHNRI